LNTPRAHRANAAICPSVKSSASFTTATGLSLSGMGLKTSTWRRAVARFGAGSAGAGESPRQGRYHDRCGDGVQRDQGCRGGGVEAEREVRDEGQCCQGDRCAYEGGPWPAGLARHDGGDADAEERECQPSAARTRRWGCSCLCCRRARPRRPTRAPRGRSWRLRRRRPRRRRASRPAVARWPGLARWGLRGWGPGWWGSGWWWTCRAPFFSAGRPVRPAYTHSTNGQLRIRQVARRNVLPG
jgi:hypothetical protein